ncbi:MAG: hypothetical protein NZ899_02460 [Thermoguttaceae bacterium]|nr:hypothetical protein [Thermoguttaceae bacterium]MDW8079812.1 hypothetical protein [Thermoguttaceae bacterium]
MIRRKSDALNVKRLPFLGREGKVLAASRDSIPFGQLPRRVARIGGSQKHSAAVDDLFRAADPVPLVLPIRFAGCRRLQDFFGGLRLYGT